MNQRALLIGLGLVGALFAAPTIRRALFADESSADDTYEEPGIVEYAMETVASTFSGPPDLDPDQSPNLRAFLDMIGYSEGAGYNTLFGGGTFGSYADHPRQIIEASGYRSSAAGKYQILARTWDDVRGKIGAADFSPYWQDRAAVYLIKRRGGLDAVLAGYFADAVAAVRKEWASLPGAGYGQPERQLARLQDAYTNAGGLLA